ncbi:MAG TPA: hypothetical protein VN778_02590, partial [Verrucomicrobiae bacterium]|nr:hypothetical protein [Verrucomicrobiae bacterium]
MNNQLNSLTRITRQFHNALITRRVDMNKLRRFGKLLYLWFSALVMIVLLTVQSASAVTATTITVGETPMPSTAPDLIVTSIVGNARPMYVELYNQGDSPINLAGWQVNLIIHDGVLSGCADVHATIDLPNAWLLSKKYVTLEDTSLPQTNSLTVPFFIDSAALTSCASPKLTTVYVINATANTEQVVTIPANEWSVTTLLVAQHRQRSNSPSSARSITNIFDTDYKFVTGAVALNSDPLYLPPADSAGLQISEILPNARSCSPTESDPSCNDYIKLYNPSQRPI